MIALGFTFDDGGRALAGFKGKAGDCAARAIAIATAQPYRVVYDGLNALAVTERTGKRKRGKSNARTGVYGATVRRYMSALGWRWIPTMGIGTGCRVHLRRDELPSGRIVALVSKHYVAVIDGTARDTYDSSRGGMRCVYGYFARD